MQQNVSSSLGNVTTSVGRITPRRVNDLIIIKRVTCNNLFDIGSKFLEPQKLRYTAIKKY